MLKSPWQTPCLIASSAGIGLAPNGLRAMDIIEPEFRPKYEKICVGNKPADAQDVFFEGLLIEHGLGAHYPPSSLLYYLIKQRLQAKINHGTGIHHGVTLNLTVNRSVTLQFHVVSKRDAEV